MWLTGNKIRESVLNNQIEIIPFHDENINPNSYNYTLFPVLKRIKNKEIDLKTEDSFEEITISKDEGYLLLPGECYLGCTNEVFCSSSYASLVTGRSSIGRKFITNHITAGLIDQGFKGRITLEITVTKPTRIYPHIPFGQIFWFQTTGDALLYDGRYQNQLNPQISKASQNLKKTTKYKKLYLVPESTNSSELNFENNLYLQKDHKIKSSITMDSKFKKQLKEMVLDQNIDRIEITGGRDPILFPKIDSLILFIKKSLNIKIKLYTKTGSYKKIPKVDEINICSLAKKRNIKELIKTLEFYRPLCDKLRVTIPLTYHIGSPNKIKKLSIKLSSHCDEIVFRPVTKKFKKHEKYKPDFNYAPKIEKVKYDKIENEIDLDDNSIILGKL